MKSDVAPIRDLEKIRLMKDILRQQSHRNFLLFVTGINIPLHIHELISLKVGDVVDEQGQVRPELTLRKEGRRLPRIYPLNGSIQDALRDYPPLKKGPDAPLFPSSHRQGRVSISRYQAYRIIHGAAERAGVENAGTLSLRKTFGYHVYQRTGSLSLTQALLSQNSGADTLRYIGVDPPPAQDIPEDWNPDLNL